MSPVNDINISPSNTAEADPGPKNQNSSNQKNVIYDHSKSGAVKKEMKDVSDLPTQNESTHKKLKGVDFTRIEASVLNTTREPTLTSRAL